MIKLIFILLLRVASNEPIQLESHDICVQFYENNPADQTYYDLEREIYCIPPGSEFRDLIFKNGFESN